MLSFLNKGNPRRFAGVVRLYRGSVPVKHLRCFRWDQALPILIALLGLCSGIGFTQNVDTRILDGIYRAPNNPNNAIFQGFTTSSDYVAIGTPILLFGTGLLTKDKKLKKDGLTAGIAVLGTYGVGYILKNTIQRPRPWQEYPTYIPYRMDDGFSFPSGSTSVAFSAATSMVLAKPSWYVAIPAYAYAGTVGYSRMRLGAHYPSDVVVGAILGTGSVWVSQKLTSWLTKN